MIVHLNNREETPGLGSTSWATLVPTAAIPVGDSGAVCNVKGFTFVLENYVEYWFDCQIKTSQKNLTIVSAALPIAPRADWCSSCGDLLTEEILEAHSALKQNVLNWS